MKAENEQSGTSERDRPRLLQVGPLPAAVEQQLVTRYDTTPLWTQPPDWLDRQQDRFDGAVAMSRHPCSEAVINTVKVGGVLALFGAGHEKVDFDSARRRQIQVSNTPSVLNDCVADHAIGLMIACARGVASGDRFIRSGSWTTGPHPMTTSVTGKRLGIIGLGRIGMAIADRAAGFRMEIRYHNRKARRDVPYGYMDSLIDLAHWADFLMISTVGGAQTRSLITREVIDAIGPSGFLINIARGSVVDQDALTAALREGRLAGAGLDVFEQEPNVPETMLRLDTLVMTPHIAALTRETHQAMAALVLENLEVFFRKGEVLTAV